MEVENRRLGDEFKFVIPKLESLFEGEVLSCKGIITSRICSIIYGSDQCLLNTTTIIFLQYFVSILIYLGEIRRKLEEKTVFMFYFVSTIQ